jgi:hypothetical protein
MPPLGWAGLKVRAVRNITLDTRQCQLGRRIAPPVIATFELAHVLIHQSLKREERPRLSQSEPLYLQANRSKLADAS